MIDKDGWNSWAVRKFASINRPYLKVERNSWTGAKPPEWEKVVNIRNMLALDVEYPDLGHDIVIPGDWLAVAVPELRKNLDHVLQLETKTGGYGLKNV